MAHFYQFNEDKRELSVPFDEVNEFFADSHIQALLSSKTPVVIDNFNVILVTGGAGFIGSSVSDYLLSRGTFSRDTIIFQTQSILN